MKQQQVTNEQREWQCQRAFALSEEGWWQKDIARALGVSEGAVSGWINAAEKGAWRRSRLGPDQGPYHG
jgi:transposase